MRGFGLLVYDILQPQMPISLKQHRALGTAPREARHGGTVGKVMII